MSAGFDAEFFANDSRENPECCSVVSIYEDAAGRETLFHLAGTVEAQFSEVQFHTDWWRFKFLSDPEIAHEAARKAIYADLIFLAPRSPALPGYLEQWFEGWLPNRARPDGALVLVQPSPVLAAHPHAVAAFLSRTAQRANLDYLRLDLPERSLTPIQTDLFHSRINLANPIDIPMHWGINE